MPDKIRFVVTWLGNAGRGKAVRGVAWLCKARLGMALQGKARQCMEVFYGFSNNEEACL